MSNVVNKSSYNEAVKMFDIINAYLCEVFNVTQIN